MSDGWTLQIEPDDIEPDDGVGRRSIRIPRHGLVLAAAGAAAAAALVAGAVVVLSAGLVHGTDTARLAEENQRLRTSLEAMERQTDTLGRAMDRLAAREERFRVLAGLPVIDPEVREVGVGGPGGLARDLGPRIGELDQLVRRAELLSSSLSEANDSLRVHRDVFLARPSIQPVMAEDAWISSGYSHARYHPILLESRPHEGVDISARPGAPILATARGRVTRAGQVAGYGRMVEVDHGFGYRTRYAHASRIRVRPGQRVERGDVLAEVGNSGLTTGPNVHYEVLVDGRPVDPRPYLLTDRDVR